MKYRLTVYEERILRIMRRYYDWMNVNEIAKESNIHWITTKRHLKKLRRKGLIEIKKIKEEETNKKNIFWRAKRVQLTPFS